LLNDTSDQSISSELKSNSNSKNKNKKQIYFETDSFPQPNHSRHAKNINSFQSDFDKLFSTPISRVNEPHPESSSSGPIQKENSEFKYSSFSVTEDSSLSVRKKIYENQFVSKPNQFNQHTVPSRFAHDSNQ
jgi:hypothetical protein